MVLKLDQVSVTSPNATAQGPRIMLVDDTSFSVAAGETLAIIGPNGAGKSTLLKAIAGEWNHSGKITIEGLAEPSAKRARQFAVLPQQSLLNFPYRVSEVVNLGRIPHATGSQLDRDIVQAALELMDVAYLSERIYTELSGGEKQRVQLARVLTQIWRAEDAEHGTRLLLLDEPTSALDLGHQQDLLRAVSSFAEQGVAVVMVLHDVNLAARYADKLLAMICSQTVAYGTGSEIITEELIEKLFGIKANIVTHPETGTPVVIPS